MHRKLYPTDKQEIYFKTETITKYVPLKPKSRTQKVNSDRYQCFRIDKIWPHSKICYCCRCCCFHGLYKFFLEKKELQVRRKTSVLVILWCIRSKDVFWLSYLLLSESKLIPTPKTTHENHNLKPSWFTIFLASNYILHISSSPWTSFFISSGNIEITGN